MREVEQKQCKVRKRRNNVLRKFEPGDFVAVRNYRKKHSQQTSETVTAHTRPVSYFVEVTPEFTQRRHAVQSRSSNVPIQQDLNIHPSKTVASQQPLKVFVTTLKSSAP